MQASDAYRNNAVSTSNLKKEKETDCSGLSPGHQQIETLPREAIDCLLRVGQLVIGHEIRKDPAILLVVNGFLNMPRNDHLQLVHQALHVVTHVVGKIRGNGNSSPRRRHVAHHVRAVEEALGPAPKVWRPPVLVREPHGLPKGVLRDDVGRVAVEGLLHVKDTPRAQQLVARALGELVDLPLELEHLGPREEPVHREPPRPVELVPRGREAADEDGARGARVEEVLPLVSLPVARGVDLVNEPRVVAMQLFGVDSHNGS